MARTTLALIHRTQPADRHAETAIVAAEVEPALSKPEDALAALKSQFLASLNHEVRTPLTGILGMTDLLLETALSEEQKEYVATARGCADDLLALFNKTLEFSDLCAGGAVLAQQEMHLPESIRGVVSAHASNARAKGLALTCRLSPHLPEVVVGDARRLQQVLFHILDNAVKFTERGSVQVSASGHALGSQFMLRLEVRDSCIGIPPDKLLAVFESFRQLDGGLSRNYSGLGLGLSVVKKLVEIMGGNISVESDLGRGSSFSVTLPLDRPQSKAAPPPSGLADAAEPVGRGRRVLLVEDNKAAQRIVRHILDRPGYEVACAASGLEALEASTLAQYDLILMDLQMPEMDGFETSARLRELEGYRSTPIVAITANATEAYRRLCFANGMQGFVPKPVEAEQLLEAISSALG